MLNEFMRERDEKQARLEQQCTTKTAHIQCNRRNALEKSDVAVQTEFPDIMDDLKEQIRQLTKIVADLSSLKNRHQSEVRINQLHDKDILFDSLSDVLPFDMELSSNQPVLEMPPEPPSTTQSVPLAVVNSGAMLPPLPLPPSLRSPLSTIDQNAPLVQRSYSSYGPTDDHRWRVESIISFRGNIITTAMVCVDVLFG